MASSHLAARETGAVWLNQPAASPIAPALRKPQAFAANPSTNL